MARRKLDPDLKAAVLAAVQSAGRPVSAHEVNDISGADTYVSRIRSALGSLERAGLIVRTDDRNPITYRPA